MWLSFWKSRDRFSIDNLRYLADQLAKVQVVNEVNKDFVIEAIRSIAELIIYGDQHDDSTFFELFMEKQIMGEFERILKCSRTLAVSLQLLQTLSILMQNLKKEHAIYYMFSNEHMNHFITYAFDFRHHDLLSYYISFLRAISGKLDQNTISLLVKTDNEHIVSFPLYVEAIKFAFHGESMIRTAVRNLTLNIYIVGDESVNKYITSAPHAEFFLNLVTFFRKQCIDLDCLVSDANKNPSPETVSSIHAAVDEIEDTLYYFSDVISAGILDVGRLMTDNLLVLLIFPILFPSLSAKLVNEIQFGAVTSLFLLCCVLRIVKIKDLANVIAASLFLPISAFIPMGVEKPNGYSFSVESSLESKMEDCSLKLDDSLLPSSSQTLRVESENGCHGSHLSLREALLYYVTDGDDVQVSGSLCVLATLLQTKELDESMLDALGILPQRKQHKKLLLEALVGEGVGEEQLFSTESNSMRDCSGTELDCYLQKLKVKYRVKCFLEHVGASPRLNRFEVLDALVNLFCRSNISAETMWEGGWLLRQLLPYSEAEFNSDHLKLLNDSYRKCSHSLLMEVKGIWPDLVIQVLNDEWKKCKRAIEASSPRKELKSVLLSSQKSYADGESSFAAGERMSETVKVFVLLHQLQTFSLGRILPDQPPINSPDHSYKSVRAKTAGIDAFGPKPGTELSLVDAVPCRIAFERGKERHFHFLPISFGTSGWVILAEELPLKQHYGIVRVAAPLAGSNPRVEEKHPRWLHLRIRPSSLPFVGPAKFGSHPKPKMKSLVDGRWTLAFRDEESCKSAMAMILKEIDLLSNEVEKTIKPLLAVEGIVHISDPSSDNLNSSSS